MSYMKRLFAGGLLCLMITGAFGQQAPKYSQYMFNPMAVNAGYAGSRDALSIHLVHRQQWIGFNGAPVTENLSIHTPLKNQNMAVGFSLMNDNIGPRNGLQISGVYAYRLRLGQGKLAMALRGGVYNYSFNWNKIEYHNPADNVHQGMKRVNSTVGNVDFALFYNTKKTYVGAELAHLNSPNFKIGDTLFTDFVPHAHFLAGHAFRVSDEVILRPSMLIRTTEVTGAWDVNISALWKEKLWTGISLRSNYGIVAIVEMNINDKLRAGLSYDYALNKLRGNQGGSIEIFLGYDLNIFKSKMISPRFF